MTDSTPSYYRYWGKAEKDGDKYHLLVYHCLDVAAVGEIILKKNPLLLKRLSEISGIEKKVLKKLLVFFLALHDLGKFAESFQFVIPKLFNKLQGRITSYKQPYSRKHFGHDSIGFLLWKGFAFNNFAQQIQDGRASNADDWWDILKWFLETSNGHHGLPVKQNNKSLSDYFTEFDLQNTAELIEAFRNLFSLKISPSIELDKDYDRLYKKLSEASWIFAGFNVLADWIGSGEHFKYISEEKSLKQYWRGTALKKAEIAIQIASILPCKSNVELDPLTELLDLSQNAKLTPLQELMRTIRIPNKPQLFIIEDATGAGKTEACLILLNRLMSKGLANGFYLGLPTMATADGLYPRVQKAYNKFYLDDQKPSLILAHSSAKLSDKFTDTIISSEHAITEQPYMDDASSICQEWLADNRKKALLAHIGMGTIDQAFLSVLKTKYQSLRLIGLLGKVLVIDEAHAYDAYMGKELEVLLQVHAALGGSAIIMSATLPFSVRQKFAKAFLSGLNLKPLELEQKVAYPLLTHVWNGHKEEVSITRDPRKAKKDVQIVFVHSEDEIYNIIKQCIARDQSVCWIRNSVKDARLSFLRLKNVVNNIELFHARFTIIDRSCIQDRVMKAFDKSSCFEQRHGKLVIATQVVEQSLDLDFDVMITDLAPIDLLLQRAGRMHRHVRDKYGNPKCEGEDERGLACLYIHTPEYTDTPQRDWISTFFPNAKKVYENHARLWLSLKQLHKLPDKRLPENIRTLIENVYDKNAEVPEGLLETDINSCGNESSQRTTGAYNTINYEIGYTSDGQIWEDDLKMPTRLGEETVILTLAKWQNGKLMPFSTVRDKAWQKNEIRVLKKNINQIPLTAEQQTAADKIKQNMPSKGKWINFLPMVWDDEEVLWSADVIDTRSRVVKVYYSNEQGFIYGYEIESIQNDEQLEKDELI
jgi:CRISPR-associated endonuclease/helicase Cas3